MPNYDFEKFLSKDGPKEKLTKEEAKQPEEISRQEETRTNLHVVSCCGNCNYFYYGSSNSQRIGFCSKPNPEVKRQEVYATHTRIDYNEADKHWLRTHVTMKCDAYERRDKYYSIERVAKWLRMPLNEDGTVMTESDITRYQEENLTDLDK